MMKYFVFMIGYLLMATLMGCSSSGNMDQQSSEEERISLNINEAVYFEFIKADSTWDGTLATYKLNEEGEKVVDKKFVSAQDSSWNDFDDMVEFLKIMQLPPQNEIEGWVPDSSVLPRRVYSFEVFNGDTTYAFSYQDPINELGDYWQSQNVLTFVTFIQNDLRWVEKQGNIE